VTNCFLLAAVDPRPQDSRFYGICIWYLFVGVHQELFPSVKETSVTQLTIDSKSDLLLPCPNTRDHGTTNVFPSILLPHRFQCQEVVVAKNLRKRSQRSSDAMTAKEPLHLWWQQCSAERKTKAAHRPFNALKGTSSQLLKSNLGSELSRERLWPLMLTKEKVELGEFVHQSNGSYVSAGHQEVGTKILDLVDI